MGNEQEALRVLKSALGKKTGDCGTVKLVGNQLCGSCEEVIEAGTECITVKPMFGQRSCICDECMIKKLKVQAAKDICGCADSTIGFQMNRKAYEQA